MNRKIIVVISSALKSKSLSIIVAREMLHRNVGPTLIAAAAV